VLLADEFSNEIVTALLLNRVKSNLRAVALKYGIWTEDKSAVLGDISASTGAVIINEKNDLTLAAATAEHLGRCDKIIIGLSQTTILNHAKTKKLTDHILRLRSALKTADDGYTKTRLKERISKLENGIATISVGCPTAAETKEKRLRIDDAVSAVSAALKSGVAVGGGLAYYNLADKIAAIRSADKKICSVGKKDIGAKILCESLPSIIKAIYKNANLNFRKAKKMLHGEFGFNAKNNEYCNLFDARIIDPAAVITTVIRNSVSAAAILITTNGIITA
jgi:chaperonin GroEL